MTSNAERVERLQEVLKGSSKRIVPLRFDHVVALFEEYYDLRRKIDALIQVGDFRIEHIYNGECPDLGENDDRDPYCPACIILDDALTTPTNPEGVDQ
ncbi:hypothetical protein [Frigoribacterium sp. UYMn621]|uniref:hypothetical protein n=1 Tax=Frigoribacterium sp. UYMn621 TaxID=3156343 RepID=UPI0033910938